MAIVVIFFVFMFLILVMAEYGVNKLVKTMALMTPLIVSGIILIIVAQNVLFNRESNTLDAVNSINIGISVLGIAVTVWIGLNIYNIVEKKDIEDALRNAKSAQKIVEKLKIETNGFDQKIIDLVNSLEETRIKVKTIDASVDTLINKVRYEIKHEISRSEFKQAIGQDLNNTKNASDLVNRALVYIIHTGIMMFESKDISSLAYNMVYDSFLAMQKLIIYVNEEGLEGQEKDFVLKMIGSLIDYIQAEFAGIVSRPVIAINKLQEENLKSLSRSIQEDAEKGNLSKIKESILKITSKFECVKAD